jgi:hypothetical protein
MRAPPRSRCVELRGAPPCNASHKPSRKRATLYEGSQKAPTLSRNLALTAPRQSRRAWPTRRYVWVERNLCRLGRHSPHQQLKYETETVRESRLILAPGLQTPRQPRSPHRLADPKTTALSPRLTAAEPPAECLRKAPNPISRGPAPIRLEKAPPFFEKIQVFQGITQVRYVCSKLCVTQSPPFPCGIRQRRKHWVGRAGPPKPPVFM